LGSHLAVAAHLSLARCNLNSWLEIEGDNITSQVTSFPKTETLPFGTAYIGLGSYLADTALVQD